MGKSARLAEHPPQPFAAKRAKDPGRAAKSSRPNVKAAAKTDEEAYAGKGGTVLHDPSLLRRTPEADEYDGGAA